MRYRVYHAFSPDEKDMKKRKGCILVIDDSLINLLWGSGTDFYTIPRKRITIKFIGMLTNPLYSKTLVKEYLDDLKNSTSVIKEYELLPHNSSK